VIKLKVYRDPTIDYLMKNDLVYHSIDCTDDTKRNQNHTTKAKHLVTFTNDIMIKALGDRSVFVPGKRKKSNNYS
jgi:hypothetical protein